MTTARAQRVCAEPGCHARMPSTKLCECGCGQPAPIAQRTYARLGHVKGEPIRFINGHNVRGQKPPRKSDRYRVEDRGHTTPCWVWRLATTPNGYGHVVVGGRHAYAHRVYWEQANGPIHDGVELDHLCRVRACVNPAHLEPVTHAENIRRGANAKLTASDVAEIRRMIAAGGLTNEAIAERFGVHGCQVSRIKTGKRWAA